MQGPTQLRFDSATFKYFMTQYIDLFVNIVFINKSPGHVTVSRLSFIGRPIGKVDLKFNLEPQRIVQRKIRPAGNTGRAEPTCEGVRASAMVRA